MSENFMVIWIHTSVREMSHHKAKGRTAELGSTGTCRVTVGVTAMWPAVGSIQQYQWSNEVTVNLCSGHIVLLKTVNVVWDPGSKCADIKVYMAVLLSSPAASENNCIS